MFEWLKKQPPTPAESRVLPVEDYSDPRKLMEMFRNETGITFEKQRSVVTKKLTSFCKLRKIPSFDVCAERLETDGPLRQELINYLTTNESYFYREFSQIEALVSEARAMRQYVTILCAPSATGEEPYSIAIALLEAGVTAFEILGIDINTEALARAREARYSSRSIRNIPPALQTRYFRKAGDRWQLEERVRGHVRFEAVNLFDPAFKALGTFDFVLSRNMLIYFDADTKNAARQILESMRKNPEKPVFYGHADLF